MSIDLDNFQGVDIYVDSELTIVDKNIDHFFMRKNSEGSEILIHKALSEDDLLDRVIEWDSEAVEIFLERLKKNRIVLKT